MSRTIAFKIDKAGNVRVEGVCGAAPGPECLDATKLFEAVLGDVQESTREITEGAEECQSSVDNTNG